MLLGLNATEPCVSIQVSFLKAANLIFPVSTVKIFEKKQQHMDKCVYTNVV